MQELSSLLKGFHPPNLQQVKGHLSGIHGGLKEIRRLQKDKSKLDACMELEQALLRFPQPRLLFSCAPHHHYRQHLWSRELGDHFAILRNRNALAVNSDSRECYQRGQKHTVS